jgi:uncharacterized protein
MRSIVKTIAEELNFRRKQVKATIRLFDDGNTVPFIARYRKEMTGKLTEEEIREIEERVEYLRNLQSRKKEVIRLIEDQDKLTGELRDKIKKAEVLQEVEDLYRPYKQKRRTKATKAREKGLEPLAELIWDQNLKEANLDEIGQDYLNKEEDLETISDVYQGARNIIAEWISDDAQIRKEIRQISFAEGQISSLCKEEESDEEGTFELYYDYQESLDSLPPHRILAINRGEDEDVLKVNVLVPEEEIIDLIKREVISEQSIFITQLKNAIKDSYKRLIAPSIEREIRNNLTERAEEHAIDVFGQNLRSLLLQPPYRGHVVMGIDPAFRTGSKICVVDKTGQLLITTTICPHEPHNKKSSARKKIINLAEKYNVDTVAIGNGTASRETELFVADIIKDGLDINYIIVNEAGASVYSASKVARKEFPELDVALRGAVSIARRLQDPLAELVKIEPRSIGVGLYQHDINQNKLDQSLRKVVESVVNYVGVDLNTASPSLLQYVAGINSSVAENIVKYKEENGSFTRREELKEVYRLGPKTFKQAAGFTRVFSKEDLLAQTPIHPESYDVTESLLKELEFSPVDIADDVRLEVLKKELKEIDVKRLAEKLECGIPTLTDIIKALRQPGRDPRDELAKPVFREDILQLEDLKKDMILQGTVRNVVDFGAFVDIGVKEDGLVHISELSYDYVEDPLDVVQVGDIIKVKILKVDLRRKRVGLSMKL